MPDIMTRLLYIIIMARFVTFLQLVGTFIPNLVHAAIMLDPAATSTSLPLWVNGTMLNVTTLSLVECTDKIDGAKKARALTRKAKRTKSDRAIEIATTSKKA